MRVLGPMAVIGLMALAGFVGYQIHYGTIETVTVQVEKTERVVDKDSSKYLVFTTDEVFENTDSIFALKFNSSDVYAKIKNGQTCTFKVNGFRVPFFSMYRNILEIKECNDQNSN